jgi:hypothetical protein
MVIVSNTADSITMQGSTRHLAATCTNPPMPIEAPASIHFQTHGYVLLEGVMDAQGLAHCLRQLSTMDLAGAGTRNLLREAWCADLARSLQAHPALAPLLPQGAQAVQCTYFEKSAQTNWLVPLHQDLSVPATACAHAAAASSASHKEGDVYVQPGASVLEHMVGVRLHLDPCGAEDGALRVVPGSHQHGVLAETAIAAVRAQTVLCPAAPGDALVLRPLLLHASSKASGTSQRRVLHFLFSPF